MTAAGCLDPGSCQVPDPGDVDLRRLRITRLPAGASFHTAYRRAHWPSLFNPSSAGNARFSPFAFDGATVPTLYGATTQTVALLETCFHDVHEIAARMISEVLALGSRGLVALSTPTSLPLVDLRNAALDRLGLARTQLVATTPAHYACTREWVAALHGRRIGGIKPVGLLWESRIAELAQSDSLLLSDLLSIANEVFVLFGDRVETEAAMWHPGAPHYADLMTGDGRLLAEQVAEQLAAVIV